MSVCYNFTARTIFSLVNSSQDLSSPEADTQDHYRPNSILLKTKVCRKLKFHLETVMK